MIQDGIYEYPVVAIATEAGNNKVNVHHEPIYFIINQHDNSSLYYKINRLSETMQINLFFSLTSEHIKKQLRLHYERKGYEVDNVEPIYPAKTLIVMRDETKEYDSIIIDQQSHEHSGDVFSAIFSIPEQDSDNFLKKLQNKKLSFFVYYIYWAEENSKNTYQIQSDYVFSDELIDSIFAKEDFLYFSKYQIDQLFSKAMENISIFAYIENEGSIRLIDFQEDFIKTLEKKNITAVSSSMVSSYLKKPAESSTVYRISKEQFKEVGFKIVDATLKNMVFAKGLAIRKLSDHHIYLKNLNKKFYSLQNQVEPVGNSKKIACNLNVNFDGVLIQSNQKSITISKGQTQHTYPIENCYLLILSKTDQHFYLTIEIDDGKKYLFQFDKLLNLQQQDIVIEGELVMKLVPKNIYLFNRHINANEHYKAYSATKTCDFKYGVFTNNGSILTKHCDKDHYVTF